MVEIELNNISRKYEAYRLKNNYKERQLLSSIVENGITEPLSCIRKSEDQYILLDGYKRLRCLYKLKIGLIHGISTGAPLLRITTVLELTAATAEISSFWPGGRERVVLSNASDSYSSVSPAKRNTISAFDADKTASLIRLLSILFTVMS